MKSPHRSLPLNPYVENMMLSEKGKQSLQEELRRYSVTKKFQPSRVFTPILALNQFDELDAFRNNYFRSDATSLNLGRRNSNLRQVVSGLSKMIIQRPGTARPKVKRPETCKPGGRKAQSRLVTHEDPMPTTEADSFSNAEKFLNSRNLVDSFHNLKIKLGTSGKT